jgi:hypothetical protein
MSGAIPPLPQYAFMAWCLVKSTGTTLPLLYFISRYYSGIFLKGLTKTTTNIKVYSPPVEI